MLRTRQNTSERGILFSASPSDPKNDSSFFFFLPLKSQPQNSAVQIPLPPREAAVGPRGQSEHQPERGSGRKSRGKNVHSSACEVCAFFSEASPPGPAAPLPLLHLLHLQAERGEAGEEVRNLIHLPEEHSWTLGRGKQPQEADA